MWKATINVSSPSWETIYRANSSCAFTPSPGEGHVQRSAQPGAAASARFLVRCFPTLLSFEAFPNNRTQRSQCGSQHARPGSRAPPRGSPSPTWVENPQRAGQQPSTMSVWAAQANAGWLSLEHTCTGAPSSPLPLLCRASVQRAPSPPAAPQPSRGS